MKDERIIKINKFGKVSRIIAKIIMVCAIIGAVATAGLGIAGMFVPNDIAKIDISGTAKIEISEKYYDIGKKIISDVNEGMSEEGQKLDIDGSEYILAQLNDEGNTLSLDYNKSNTQIGVRNFAVMMISICLECVNIAVLLGFVVALCKAIELCQSPFEDNIINKMKRLAIAFVPWVLVGGIAKSLGGYAFTDYFDFNSGFGLDTVLIVLVIILLISVFRYGAILQQQSDETL